MWCQGIWGFRAESLRFQGLRFLGFRVQSFRTVRCGDLWLFDLGFEVHVSTERGKEDRNHQDLKVSFKKPKTQPQGRRSRRVSLRLA